MSLAEHIPNNNTVYTLLKMCFNTCFKAFLPSPMLSVKRRKKTSTETYFLGHRLTLYEVQKKADTWLYEISATCLLKLEKLFTCGLFLSLVIGPKKLPKSEI